MKPNGLQKLLFVLVISHVISSCTSSAKNETQQTSSSTAPLPVPVTTAVAGRKTFYHELICNGVVEAERSARIGFDVQGFIESIPVVNGQPVQEGQVLATLDNREQQMALERARNSLLRAKIEMKDFLLAYSANADTANLPPQVLQTARIRSGLAEAELQVRELEYRLSKTVLTAPFSGRVVDLKAKPFHPTSSFEYLCNIVDEGSLKVSFNVLESELQMAEPGTEVEVVPFSNPEAKCRGIITEVNRRIDNTGMVSVAARLNRLSGTIIPGMNVRVLVRKPLQNALVIPAEALTNRQSRNVVFTLEDTLAIWNYVEIGPRNTSEVVILDGLNEGDTVIVSGNSTIGHEAWVKPMEKE